jgi:hypothetical protein
MIKFQVNYVDYYWHKASETVYDKDGRVAASNCFNLQIARNKLKKGWR